MSPRYVILSSYLTVFQVPDLCIEQTLVDVQVRSSSEASVSTIESDLGIALEVLTLVGSDEFLADGNATVLDTDNHDILEDYRAPTSGG